MLKYVEVAFYDCLELQHSVRMKKKKNSFFPQQRNYFSCIEPFDIKNIVNSYNGVSNTSEGNYTNFKCTDSGPLGSGFGCHLMKVLFLSPDEKKGRNV